MLDMQDNAPGGCEEAILEPALRICDAHHHLWNRADQRYLIPELLADLRTGHDVRSTVYVEWRSHYREDGPPELRPVGETEFAAAAAEQALHSGVAACAAIVGYANLSLGDAVADVLEAHLAAGKGRFRAIRDVGSWDADELVRGGPLICAAGLYRDARFRAGFAQLEPLGLSFDAWSFQTQLDDVIDLAHAFPHQSIVMNHAGGVLGIGSYASQRRGMFSAWRAGIEELARCPNVTMKLGGLGMKRSGFPFHGRPEHSTSEALATAWRPWLETCIEEFGPQRCMFESNFPVDAASCSYRVLWNAFKRIVAGASTSEKRAVLHDTAARVYRIA